MTNHSFLTQPILFAALMVIGCTNEANPSVGDGNVESSVDATLDAGRIDTGREAALSDSMFVDVRFDTTRDNADALIDHTETDANSDEFDTAVGCLPACTGLTYCDRATRQCLAGCDNESTACPGDQICNAFLHRCECAFGYRASGAEFQCEDIDECASNNGGCGVGACMNSAGSFSCVCDATMRNCGGACVLCPSDAFATSNRCDGNRCVLAACATPYVVDHGRQTCVATAAAWTAHPESTLSTRPAGSSYFGSGVALSTNGLVLSVGDTGVAPRGAVRIFQRATVDQSFAQVDETLIAPSTSNTFFGSSVALDRAGLLLAVGDISYIVVGAGSQGSVQVFQRANTAEPFSLRQILVPAASSELLDFGQSVAFTGDGLQLIVGDSAGRGAVHIYTRATLDADFAPTPAQSIVGPSGSGDFGFSVVASGDARLLVVGDPTFYANQRRVGAVHVFDRANPSVAFAGPSQTFVRPSASAFGGALTLGNRELTLLVGSGDAVHEFSRSSSAVAFAGPPAEAQIGSQFELALSDDGHQLFVAAPLSNAGQGPGGGVVWAYRR